MVFILYCETSNIVLSMVVHNAESIHDRLVVWNTFFFFHILGMIIPIDELICFRGVQTTDQILQYFNTVILGIIFLYLT